jgi:hypothetical protein
MTTRILKNLKNGASVYITDSEGLPREFEDFNHAVMVAELFTRASKEGYTYRVEKKLELTNKQ